MEQKEFSNLIFGFLEENYPEFIQTINFRDDRSFDCSLKSESGIFLLWIDTYGSEITIGIEDPNGDANIHTHISCYDLEDLEDCVMRLSEKIDDIKEDKLILYKNVNGCYHWINSTELENQNYIEKFSWKSNHNVT